MAVIGAEEDDDNKYTYSRIYTLKENLIFVKNANDWIYSIAMIWLLRSWMLIMKI